MRFVDDYLEVCNWSPTKGGRLRNTDEVLEPYLTAADTSHAALIRNDTPQLNYTRRQRLPRPAPPASPPLYSRRISWWPSRGLFTRHLMCTATVYLNISERRSKYCFFRKPVSSYLHIGTTLIICLKLYEIVKVNKL